MPRILFVEDDLFIADIYKRKFDAAGFETVNVTTGKAVLKVAKEQEFDLILLDLVLPEMNGKEVLRELRGGGYGEGLHIVVFSNLSTVEDREECLKLGADGFISKTEFTPSEVVEEVRRFLRQFEEQGRHAGRHSEEDSEPPAGRNGKRILFIEDEEVFVEMFGRRLREEGYEVEIRTEGVSGLEAALGGGFDLVISDIMMPGMNGSDIVSRIRESDAVKETPIFLLSASVDDGHLQDIFDSGTVEEVFMKTEMTPSELARKVSDFFENNA